MKTIKIVMGCETTTKLLLILTAAVFDITFFFVGEKCFKRTKCPSRKLVKEKVGKPLLVVGVAGE